jgi:hypothetical protein
MTLLEVIFMGKWVKCRLTFPCCTQFHKSIFIVVYFPDRWSLSLNIKITFFIPIIT